MTGGLPDHDRTGLEAGREGPSKRTIPGQVRQFAIIVEYEGTNYHGFQLQAGPNTIQAELEKAVYRLTGEARRVIPASRTDAGVHATAQVATFRVAGEWVVPALRGGLNHYLPGDIGINAVYRVPDGFNARREALSREYKYYLLNREARSPLLARYSYLVKGELDVEAMNEACGMLCGEHDFIAFASALEARHTGRTRRRVIRAAVFRERPDVVVFEIEANSFLTHQVRNTVGTLIRVGQHRAETGEITRLLAENKAGVAGPGVPPSGLFLTAVNYPYSFKEVTE